MIKVASEPFDPLFALRAHEERLGARLRGAGAQAMFVGSMRDFNEGEAVEAMVLEHYPGMTEKALAEIDAEAGKRWPLEASLIIHRHGRLLPGDAIVLVITASAHRQAAFEACSFLMDWLKTKAPFWKLEESAGKTRWVEAKDDDDAAARRWDRRQH